QRRSGSGIRTCARQATAFFRRSACSVVVWAVRTSSIWAPTRRMGLRAARALEDHRGFASAHFLERRFARREDVEPAEDDRAARDPRRGIEDAQDGVG